MHICTYQSPSGSDGQSGFPIRSQGLQAVFWHLSEAKRWKATWLLSSSCKYPVIALGSGPNRLCAFSLHSLCFIKINDKALCMQRHIFALPGHVFEKSCLAAACKRKVSKAVDKQSQVCTLNKYSTTAFISHLACLFHGRFSSQCAELKLDSIIVTRLTTKRDTDNYRIFL